MEIGEVFGNSRKETGFSGKSILLFGPKRAKRFSEQIVITSTVFHLDLLEKGDGTKTGLGCADAGMDVPGGVPADCLTGIMFW